MDSDNNTIFEKASKDDVREILELQKLAYLSEAEIIDDFTIPPLHQTEQEILSEFDDHTFLKHVVDGKITGSVRAYEEKGTCYIGKLIVHPDAQGRGIGSKLLGAIENLFPDVSRYELFTGWKSERNLHIYNKYGYSVFRDEYVSDKLTIVFMKKVNRISE